MCRKRCQWLNSVALDDHKCSRIYTDKSIQVGNETCRNFKFHQSDEESQSNFGQSDFGKDAHLFHKIPPILIYFDAVCFLDEGYKILTRTGMADLKARIAPRFYSYNMQDGYLMYWAQIFTDKEDCRQKAGYVCHRPAATGFSQDKEGKADS